MSPFFVKLKNRGLIHLEGKDRHAFLQDLMTNDIKKLSPQTPLYACLLTPQGKFLHDFFVIEGHDFTLLDCEGGARAQDLFKRLNMYRLRKDVQISVEEGNSVFAILDDGMMRSWDDVKAPSSPHPLIPSSFKDPRHPAMGYRAFEKPDLPEKPFEAWDKRRIELCIPDGSRDLIPEKSTMDEGNMDQLNAIDYQKGCYIGQELTARMHYRGLAKKKLQTVHLKENGIPDVIQDTQIIELRSTCEDLGIALVKQGKNDD